MKNAAIYMRVSTARQEEEQTIENQRMELTERIEADGNILLPDCIYMDEGWSGAIIERPALDRLRADAKDNKYEILYVYDRGRVSRKYVHQEIILEGLRECNIEVISLHDINGQSTEEILMGGVMGIFHEYERVKIAERMRIGKVRKVRENKKLLGYQPKYGYDYHPRIKNGVNARDGHFSINKAQAENVKIIYQLIADGMSKHELKRELYKLGISPPRGLRDQWSGGTLDRMLTDTTYTGKHFYNKSESIPTKKPRNPEQKYRKITKGSRRQRPQSEWLMVEVPAIIEQSLYDRVQVELAKHKRTNTRNNKKNQYLVGGLIECACGKARTGDPANKGNLYYRCTDRLSKHPLPRDCYEKGINAPVLDNLVWQNVQELLLNPELVLEQAKRWQKAASPLEKRIEELKHKLKLLDSEERRYTKAFGQGVMNEHIYKDNFHATTVKRTELNSEIGAIEEELRNKPVVPLEKLFDGVIKLVGNLDFTDKKSVVQKLITRIVATKEEVIIWGHLPIPVTEKVGYESINRYRRPPKCWQINPV